METKIIQFQVAGEWLYVLLSDGTMARRHESFNSDWQKVTGPVSKDSLITPTQKNAGIKE